MNKKKYIFFLLQLIIFNYQFSVSYAQVISNNGAVLSVVASTTVSNIGSVGNSSGSIGNEGTLNITGNITNNATISGNGIYNIAGDFINNSVFSSDTSTVNLNGTLLQTIGGSTQTTFKNIGINNSSGVNLGINTNVSGVLNFTSGVINTGANKLSITSTGSVIGAGTSKFVNGFLEKYIPVGTSVPSNFELGFGSTDYLPLNLNFASVSGAGNITASAHNGDHASIGTSCIDNTKSVNRNWSVSNSSTTFTNYSATANFIGIPTDADAGSNTANYFMSIFNSGSWTTLTQGTHTATSTQGTGITTDGDLQIGERFVGTLVFSLGTASERCRAAETVTYTVIATHTGSVTYTLDAASIAAGNSINAATGDVTYSPTYVGTSTITAMAAGCSGPVSAIHQAVSTILPVNSATIAGISCVAIGATQTYSITPVFRASSYVWTVPVGSTILSGQGTNLISVNFTSGLVNGFVTVTPQNACGIAVTTSKKDVGSGGIPAMPGTVSGPMVACSYIGVGVATYSITAVVRASSYLWAKPTGATITGGQGTTSITVTFTTSYVSGQFSVTSVDGCGTSTFDYFTVTKSPLTPASISGWANANGATDNLTLVNYTTPIVNGVSSYNWTVPANVTISSGQGTASINVTFAPAFTGGNIGVALVAACGTSAVKTKAIVNNTTTPKSLLEPAITTQKNVSCKGLNDGEATVEVAGEPSSYSFVWSTLPIQTSATATHLVAGLYTVKVTDNTGHSFIEEVTISEPSELKVTAMKINNSLYGSSTGYIVAGVSGGTGIYEYSWNTSPVQNTQDIKDIEAGTYTVTVKDENNCISYSSVVITDSLIDENASVTLKVYPVPAINQFTVEYNQINNIANYITITSFDGKTIFKSTVLESVSTQKLLVDCDSWGSGIYFVIIKDKNDNILASKSIAIIQ